MKHQTEITLNEAIKGCSNFCPIKIIFNNCVLYNDYDSEIVVDTLEDGTKVYGENRPPEVVVPNRLWMFENYLVTSIHIEIVQHHHSIVTMKGYYSQELEEEHEG